MPFPDPLASTPRPQQAPARSAWRTRTSALLPFALAAALAGCGGPSSSSSGTGRGDTADPSADGDPPHEFDIGDNIGSHGLTLEAVTTATIERLVADGADPQKPHRIEHHLAASTPAQARSIVTWGRDNGFEVVGFEDEKAEPGRWIEIDLVKEMPLQQEEIWHDARRMAALAEQLECEYDGWGCEIVR